MALEARLDAWWAGLYPQIVADLGLDAAADQEAALLLDRLLRERAATPLPRDALHLTGPVLVAGDAPSLDDDLAQRPVQDGERVLVADAAAARIAAARIEPALIVTDLDKDPARLAALNARGTPLAVHAHGDNIPLLQEWVPRLEGPVLGTRQTVLEAPAAIWNPGGFTDGDRAVILAARLGATRIRLAGFDLLGEPAAGTRDPERKRRKMRWGARILDDARALGVPLE